MGGNNRRRGAGPCDAKRGPAEAKRKSAERRKENEKKASENWARLVRSGALFLAAPCCPEEALPQWVKDIDPSHRVCVKEAG